MFESRDYREQLRSEFERRSKANPSYSMRAFARDLELAPSRLSLILRGKEGLSLARAKKLVQRLGYVGEKAELFCALVESRDSRSAAGRAAARAKIQTQWNDLKKSLNEDEFRYIGDWHHLAILHMVELADFDAAPASIAKRLALPPETVNDAIERLLRLKLLVRKGKALHKTTGVFIHSEKVPLEVVREHHRQVLAKAARAIDVQDMSERFVTSLTVAVDREKLDEANERVKSFIRDMDLLLSSASTQKDDVYCLSVQLFSLLEKSK